MVAQKQIISTKHFDNEKALSGKVTFTLPCSSSQALAHFWLITRNENTSKHHCLNGELPFEIVSGGAGERISDNGNDNGDHHNDANLGAFLSLHFNDSLSYIQAHAIQKPFTNRHFCTRQVWAASGETDKNYFIAWEPDDDSSDDQDNKYSPTSSNNTRTNTRPCKSRSTFTPSFSTRNIPSFSSLASDQIQNSPHQHYVRGEHNGTIKKCAIAPQQTNITFISRIDFKGRIASIVINSYAKKLFDQSDACYKFQRACVKVLDKELRVVFVQSINKKKNLDQKRRVVVSNSSSSTLMNETSIIEIARKELFRTNHNHSADQLKKADEVELAPILKNQTSKLTQEVIRVKGESFCTTRITGIVGTSAEEALAWVWDYTSNERTRLHAKNSRGGTNALSRFPRFVSKDHSPNHIEIISVKRLSGFFRTRSFSFHQCWESSSSNDANYTMA